jgi:hypothetical protein
VQILLVLVISDCVCSNLFGFIYQLATNASRFLTEKTKTNKIYTFRDLFAAKKTQTYINKNDI